MSFLGESATIEKHTIQQVGFRFLRDPFDTMGMKIASQREPEGCISTR
jgi:hypothetical protein